MARLTLKALLVSMFDLHSLLRKQGQTEQADRVASQIQDLTSELLERDVDPPATSEGQPSRESRDL